MGNKFDITEEFINLDEKVVELENVCDKINDTERGSHLLEMYNQKKQEVEIQRDRLAMIIDAMNAAED